MSETPMEAVESQGSCPHCKKAAEVASNSEEVSLAFLLALMPVITLTFFGQVGLL